MPPGPPAPPAAPPAVSATSNGVKAKDSGQPWRWELKVHWEFGRSSRLIDGLFDDLPLGSIKFQFTSAMKLISCPFVDLIMAMYLSSMMRMILQVPTMITPHLQNFR